MNRCVLRLPDPRKLLEPAICPLCSSPLYHPPALETRRGFLKSGLCSGKTLWLPASCHRTQPVPRRKDKTCRRIGVETGKSSRSKEKTKVYANGSRDHLGGASGRYPFPRHLVSLPLSFCLYAHLLLA